MRRFIAGAVCPACRAEDRTVLERRDDARRRLCVACGHEELEDLKGSSAPPEPPSRFNRATAPAAAVPVRLFAPSELPAAKNKEN
ncbi:MAG: YheV family putative metal-binding protein [Pseudomonadales bacterium]